MRTPLALCAALALGSSMAWTQTNPRLDAPRPIEAGESLWAEELTWMEIRDLMKAGKATTIIIGTGGVEQNGPYVAGGKHNYVLQAVLPYIARAIPNSLIAPIVKFVPEGRIEPTPSGHMAYPGTISVEQSTFIALLTDICRSYKAHGFTDIILIGDSGGNQNGMRAVADTLNARWANEKARVHYLPEYYTEDRWSYDFLKSLGITQVDSTPGRPRDARVDTRNGMHDDIYYEAQIAVVDPTLIRAAQREKAGQLTLHGVSLAPMSRTIQLGRRLAEYRAGITAKAFEASKARLRPAGSQQTTAITNVTVIAMTNAAPAARQTVLIRDGRIAEIGASGRVAIPAGAVSVDGTGKYLIPGLIEMHGHTSKSRASSLGLYVVHGVTTLRDQGSEHAEVLRWRREVNAGTRAGPRILIAGPYLESLRNIERMRRDPPESRVEPFERARIPVATPDDARRIVDSLAALEVDHFKVRTVQDRDTYIALGQAARARGKRLTGHVPTASPQTFLESGQSGVDHGFPPTLDSLPLEQRQAFWRELARRDVGVVPTLVVATESVFRPQDYFQALLADSSGTLHPLRPYLSKFMLLDWREQVEEATPQRRAAYDRLWPIALRHTREMRAAGVRLMAGADVAVLNIFPGLSLHEELRLFVDSVGMSPMEALIAATRSPAEWLGIADSVGTVAPGRVADLVLLDANPIDDIRNTRRISAVMLRGRLMQRADLDRLMAEVRAMPDIRVNDWVR